MKIAYFGFDFFYSCLEELLEQGHEVHKIFTFPCDNRLNYTIRIKNKAAEIGAELQEHRPSGEDIQALIIEGVELIVVAGYEYKLPVVTGMPKALNIHPTLLPEGRGRWPLPWIILRYPEVAGVTLHKIAEDWDSGDILLQKSIKLTDRENLETLSAKCQMLAQELLREVMLNLENYWEKATPQGKGSYWPMPGELEYTLDWTKSVEEIDRTARAFGKFESAATFDHKDWVVQDLSVWKEEHDLVPGTVAQRMDREVVIAAQDGFVCLRFFEEDK